MNNTLNSPNPQTAISLHKQGRNSFGYDDLIDCSEGRLFGPGNPQLPKPPMLMFNSIKHISDTGGAFNRGQILAELQIDPKDWFFQCHFENDPVMPGCLGVDALWQLLGFYLGWLGGQGRGRALGAGKIKFINQVLPDSKLVTYQIDIKRIMNLDLMIAVGNGRVICDDVETYYVDAMRVGLFKNNTK